MVFVASSLRIFCAMFVFYADHSVMMHLNLTKSAMSATSLLQYIYGIKKQMLLTMSWSKILDSYGFYIVWEMSITGIIMHFAFQYSLSYRYKINKGSRLYIIIEQNTARNNIGMASTGNRPSEIRINWWNISMVVGNQNSKTYYQVFNTSLVCSFFHPLFNFFRFHIVPD